MMDWKHTTARFGSVIKRSVTPQHRYNIKALSRTLSLSFYDLIEDHVECHMIYLQIALPESLIKYRKFEQFTKSLKKKKR